MSGYLIRAQIFHTPANPFESDDALVALEDGAVAVDESGRIEAIGNYRDVAERFDRYEEHDYSDSLLVPGFVDAHVHFPQLTVIGAMGMPLLQWLSDRTLPEEARYADEGYARSRARAFLRALLQSGTTSALVFGAHFQSAMEVFFQEAAHTGLRVTAGLTLGDRLLRPELETSPDAAYEQSSQLARKWHGEGRLRYAVTPRFSVSCSEPLLEACGAVLAENEGLFFTSHLNESVEEKEVVADLFPWAKNYLETYERFGLVNERSVFAHNVYPSDEELGAIAHAGSAVCHCPWSNTFIGSGMFPLRRHVERGVKLALGTDVGGGTGFGLLKEGLAAYGVQMLLEDGYELTPAHLLYLATSAGADALGLDSVGTFEVGKEFDAVLLSSSEDSVLGQVWRHSPSALDTLSAAFTLAREESVAGVWVRGERLLG